MKASRYMGFKNLPTPHALTVPRLLIATFWSDVGAFLWFALRKPLGQPGIRVFGILGFAIGLLITRAILVGRLQLLFPLPSCRQDKCHRFGQDYVWRLGTLFGYESRGIYLYRCRCGDTYIRKGKRFMSLLPDESMRPYKKLVGFRTWVDDLASLSDKL
jgi:hypothetical protein